ncbi:hypothetical protein [Bacillus cytotoxicus]|uniref:hypothetical protein n=1 Tax=Bacillus cytotoxicus TaxID=580165 RepID=UPI0008643DB7|nr:hypothetical protein [Bacillus cytotoxicus]AWC28191.1 hypothetical protein CG483_007295 [Bacillus cytotoxicus]AWC40424.1 hypothetical protein CG480_007955 [Bacillus cytotoxicus]AWC48355.1 hypothetical protein CG478_007955 [Bacillus cytotoxicus]AWC52257.1 hypothetical protein CG477_007255 [Bacillus cytotoxicus]AWC56392.1 hypothetical protein CG476_007285 [Bacillus cytotoxicus]
MKKIYIILIFCCTSMLVGCMYPRENMKRNEVPYEDQLQMVQKAVDTYKEQNNGLLPIKTRDMNTPLYQKYPIDFQKIAPRYIPEAPGNAYESGGVYQYVLVDVETKPMVKLIDVRMAEKIRDITLKLRMYRDEHQYPPYKKVIADGVYELDFKKMGYKDVPQVTSPYSGKGLPLVINEKGQIFVDYRMDLYEMLQKNKGTAKEGDDIRNMLFKDSPFVPAYSLPYTVKDGEPIFFK